MTDLLLDTHIFIWLLTGDSNLKKENLSLIEDCINNGFMLCLSAISIWEIAMLEKKKRIVLSLPVTKWINKALDKSSAKVIDLSVDIVVDSCNLPGAFHSDPADRLIVATSRVCNIPLVTQDSKILDYISQGFAIS